MKKIIIIFGLCAVLVGIFFVITLIQRAVDFDRCITSHGEYNVTTNVCTPKNSTSTMTTTQATSTTSTTSFEHVKVTSPLANAIITSPVNISGAASGWYFEGSFPITIVDADDTKIGEGYATAQGDWMTSDFVEFKGSVKFSNPTTATGKIIFHKDNPSGLPENDASVALPVRFR